MKTKENKQFASPEEQTHFEQKIKEAEEAGIFVGADVVANEMNATVDSFDMAETGAIEERELIVYCMLKGHEGVGVSAFHISQITSKVAEANEFRSMMAKSVAVMLDHAKQATDMSDHELLEAFVQQMSSFGYFIGGKVRTIDGTKRVIVNFAFSPNREAVIVESSLHGPVQIAGGNQFIPIEELIPVKSLVMTPVQPMQMDMFCDECESGQMRPIAPSNQRTEKGHEHKCTSCTNTVHYVNRFPYITYRRLAGYGE
jgi:hypothetical protein